MAADAVSSSISSFSSSTTTTAAAQPTESKANVPTSLLCWLPSRDMQIVANKWFAQNARQWPALFVALRGFRNGAVYGAKVRAPHALVTLLLYGKGSIAQRLLRVIRMTGRHSFNLGKFVFAYKMALALLSKLSGAGSKVCGDVRPQLPLTVRSWHPLLAGAVTAFFVFGNRRDGVSEQINLYLLSRVVYALFRLLATNLGVIERRRKLAATIGRKKHHHRHPLGPYLFPMFASAVWGVGLWMFENRGWTLQPSLRRSMEEIYKRGVDNPAEWGDGGLWDFLFK